MPNQTYYGLNIWVAGDTASTAIENSSNVSILDAAAGHVWQVASGTANEQVVLSVNAVSATATTAIAKFASPSSALYLNLAGLFQLFVTPTAASAGGTITWPTALFSISPTGATTAVVSASNFTVGTLLLSGTIQNATATMGLTYKKGTGAGDYGTLSTSYVDVDATNLAFTVTVPTGWKLQTIASAVGVSSGANGSLSISDGVTTLIEAPLCFNQAGIKSNACITHVLTGDGASHTLKMQFKTNSGAVTLTNSGAATEVPHMSFTLMPSN